MDMLNEKALLEFVEPYYIGKDIMHNMWHIELAQNFDEEMISKTIILEGGKTYLMVKTLITGSVRGQSLLDTLNYMEKMY